VSKRLRSVFAGAVLALIVAAGPAQASDAGSITKSSGATSATLSWQAGPDGDGVSAPHLTITRSGAVVFDNAITDVCPEGCILVADTPEFGDFSVLKVADLDGDGEPEVLVDTYSGGAHCCISTRIYSYRPATSTYTRDPSYSWLDASFVLADLDGDAKPELSGADASFSYSFTSYADSYFPPLILSFRRDPKTGRGSFKDVTRHYPLVVKADAAKLLRIIRKAKRDSLYSAQGAIAAYAADEYLLDRGSVARKELSRDRAKRLTRKGFATDLLKFLKHLGYR
jgi:hypothetical protein